MSFELNSCNSNDYNTKSIYVDILNLNSLQEQLLNLIGIEKEEIENIIKNAKEYNNEKDYEKDYKELEDGTTVPLEYKKTEIIVNSSQQTICTIMHIGREDGEASLKNRKTDFAD